MLFFYSTTTGIKLFPKYGLGCQNCALVSSIPISKVIVISGLISHDINIDNYQAYVRKLHNAS